MVKKYILIIFVLFIISNSTFYLVQTYGQKLRERPFNLSVSDPRVFDSSLKVEQVAKGLDLPTTMAFLGPDDFLILEKDKGTVMRVNNGIISGEPLLDVNVANSVERGMCGIAISKNRSTTYVFLYFTEIDGSDGDDGGCGDFGHDLMSLLGCVWFGFMALRTKCGGSSVRCALSE